MRRSFVVAWAVAAAALSLAIAGTVLSELADSHGDPAWQHVLALGAVLAAAGVGLLIAIRRHGHPIGWLLLANALLLGSFGLARGYEQYAIEEDPGALPGAEWAVLWDQSAWPLLFAIVALIVLVFPDGRLPAGRSRKLMAAAVAYALFLALSFFDPEPFEAPYENVDRPLPGLPEPVAVLWPIAFLGVIASLIGALRSARRRFRNARGIERLQLKWLAYTAILIPATLIVCVIGVIAAGGVEEEDAFNALFLLMLGATPTAIGVAVLRYRLYDIDRIINRTLVYGVLTLLLAGVYAGATLLLGTALGEGSGWTTAAATLLAAAAFQPFRRRIQDVVDRRFSRARYDAMRRIARFLEDLRAGRAAPEGIEPLLRDVLADRSLEVRFWLPASEVYVDARGRLAEDDASDHRLRTPVTRGGAPLGLVLHDPVDEQDRPRLLEDVVEAAGLAIEIARLRVELRRQLDEVEASRARIVAAGDEERRRIERDLHDGAQQRLVSIGLALRHAQHELGSPPRGAAQALDGAVEEIGLALEELRELASGVRPAQLDAGLAPALRDLAARAPLPVEVKTGAERFPDDVETAAYFVASEGLANAVKHARATRVTLRAERANGTLRVQVTDDGIGGAAANGGSGLRGLADRVEAHGGRLRVESVPGRGTTLTAELPCA